MSDNLYLFANNNGVQAENNGSYRLYDMKIEGDSEGVESGVNYVDYLEGDGASYIDTGIITNENTQIIATVQLVKRTNGCKWFGSDKITAGWQVTDNNAEILIQGNGTATNLGLGTNLYDKKIWKMDTSKVIIGEKIYLISIDGEDKLQYTITKNENSTKSLLLFASYYYGILQAIPGGFIQGKVFDFKVYKDNSLNLHLRPCLDTQGVPCMYDEVSKRYFYNQGTGTFKYKKTLRVFQPVLDSNNIPCLLDKINNKFYYNKGTGNFTYGGVQTPKDGYTEVEYIESNGTQYIDTGVVTNSNTDIDMTSRAVSNGGYILNDLQLDATYKYNGTDTTTQPNLTASTGATLTMGSQNIAYLTEAEIAQAVLNGWTIQ